MTLKTKKTLQHIAAVAVVLLTLCLVFATPVSATDGGEGEADPAFTIVGSTTSYATTLNGALNDASSMTWAVITLNDDVEIDETLTITGSNLTIDGKGHNISVSSGFVEKTKFLTIYDDETNNVTIKDVTIENGEKAQGIYLYNNGKTTPIKFINVVVNASYGSGITVGGATLVLENVKITNSGWNQSIDADNGDSNGVLSDLTMDGTTFGQLGDIVKISDESRKATIIVGSAVSNPTHNVTDNVEVDSKNKARNAWVADDKLSAFYDLFGLNASVKSNDEPVIKVYQTLANAVENANAGDTITLLKDVTLNTAWNETGSRDVKRSALVIERDIIIDGQGKTITLEEGARLQAIFSVFSDATFKNLNLVNKFVGSTDAETAARCIDTRVGDITVNIINCKLYGPGSMSQPLTIGGNAPDITVNVENTLIEACHYPIITFVPVNLNIIDNSNISGYCALYFKRGSAGTNVVVSDSKLTGTNLYSGNSNSFGVIVFNYTHDVSVTLNNADLANAVSVEGAETESIFVFTKDANTGNTVTVNSGVHLATSGSKAVFALDTFDNTLIVKNGVTSTFQIPAKYLEAGYECVGSGSSWKVQLAPAPELSYSPSAKDDNKDEPVEEPEEPVVEPETPVEVPGAGEPTVETEVTDGGEVELETPVEEPAVGEDGAVAADDEAKITAVVLPTGTDSEVTFIPISEQPAPAGQEENTKKVFEINVPTYEKGKPATIKFTMTVAELEADGKTAEQVALWHFDEETGEWTKLLTSYIIVDGVVYFEAITEDFSPFAIIYDENPVDEPVEEPETPASPAPVLGLIAALGAAVVLRRK